MAEGIDSGFDIVIAFPVDDDEWETVETGLQGHLDVEHGQVVIPFEDDTTAEEVSRILTAAIRRERSGTN